jgi:tetratricopeptide (TPR) repeat protein
VRRARSIPWSVAAPLLVLLAGCRGGEPSTQQSKEAAAGNANSSSSGKIVFFADDDAKALAEAKAKGKPLFIDVWASWCHTCMSMKEYVFPTPQIQALNDRFVWSTIDFEKAENADFLERFPSTSLPTLWVVDPANARPVLKWVGAATAPELSMLLEDAASGMRSRVALGEAAAAALRGDQATATGRSEEAVSAYREALEKTPAEWPRRARVVEALSLRLLELDRNEECVELAALEIPGLPSGTPLVNVTVNGLGAAAGLPASAPALRHLPMLVREGTRIVEDAGQPILIDDRSGLYKALVAVWHTAKPSEAKRLARSWAQLLEGAALRAGSPESRAVWDPHRLEAYIELGEAEKALPMLEQSGREFPADYNPPARLARAYLELRQFGPALSAVNRALERAHGPRMLNIFMLKADILLAQHDRPAAKRALGEALDLARQLRLPVKYQPLHKKLAERFAELG